jgi:hypothetical protein
MKTLMTCAFLAFLFSACASSEVERTGVSAPPPPPPRVAPMVQPSAAPGSAATSGAPESPVSLPQEEAPVANVNAAKAAAAKSSESIWKMKKGKLLGPGQVSPKVIGQFKDPKTGAVTVTNCWKYPGFAITESKTKGEVGAGEMFVRRSSGAARENLCAAEFPGKSIELKIIEGYFAGVAGDYIVVEGADVGEGLPQFQIFSLESAKEIYKGTHQPDEEFSLLRRGKQSSLYFFTKIPVKCELATEGAACWKKVLSGFPAVKPTPMPDCLAAFKKAKIAPEESALVTIRAEIPDLASAKLRVTGGKATCQPAPQ